VRFLWLVSSLLLLASSVVWVYQSLSDRSSKSSEKIEIKDSVNLVEQASILHAHDWSLVGPESSNFLAERVLFLKDSVDSKAVPVQVKCRTTKNFVAYNCLGGTPLRPEKAWSYQLVFQSMGPQTHWAFSRSNLTLAKDSPEGMDWDWLTTESQRLIQSTSIEELAASVSSVSEASKKDSWGLILQSLGYLRLLDELELQPFLPLMQEIIRNSLVSELNYSGVNYALYSADAVMMELYALDPGYDFPRIKKLLKSSLAGMLEGSLDALSKIKSAKGVLRTLMGGYSALLKRQPELEMGDLAKKIQAELSAREQSDSALLMKQSHYFESKKPGFAAQVIAAASIGENVMVVDAKGGVSLLDSENVLQELTKLDLKAWKSLADLVCFKDSVLGFDHYALNLENRILTTEDGSYWESFVKPEHLQGLESKLFTLSQGSGVFAGRDSTLYFSEDFENFEKWSELPVKLKDAYWFTTKQGYYLISHCESQECKSQSYSSADGKQWKALGECNMALKEGATILTNRNQLIYLDGSKEVRKSTVFRSENGVDFVADASSNLSFRESPAGAVHQGRLLYFSGLDVQGLVTKDVQVENKKILIPLANAIGKIRSKIVKN